MHRGEQPAPGTEKIVDGLVSCGLVHCHDDVRPLVGRRALISTAAAIGVTTLMLPPSSAAASGAGGLGIMGAMATMSSGSYGVVEFLAAQPGGAQYSLTGEVLDWAPSLEGSPEFVDDETNERLPVVDGAVFTVPNGVNVITVHAYATSGEGASGDFSVDETYGYSLGGTVSMSYAVLPGDRFQIVAGGTAPGGAGDSATQYGVLRGGSGGRGVGLYKIGEEPVWVAVAGGGGGVGGVETNSFGRGPNGGSGGINTSKANGTASALAGSGQGGTNGVAQPGGGAAGFDGIGTADDGGSGSANGRTQVPPTTTTTTAPVPPVYPTMWLGDGGAGGSGGIGGGGGGSGYFGGGGGGAGLGGNAEAGANLGYGGGGGAGGSYVVSLGLVGTPAYDWAHRPVSDGPRVVIEFDIAT